MTNTIQTLDASLQSLITTVVAGAEKAGGFVAEEVPIVIDQLLAWKFTMSLLGFTLGVILLLPIYPLAKFALKGWMDEHENAATNGIAAVIGSVATVSFAVFSPVLLVVNLDWLQIAIAPKLYLLEYAANLIK